MFGSHPWGTGRRTITTQIPLVLTEHRERGASMRPRFLRRPIVHLTRKAAAVVAIATLGAVMLGPSGASAGDSLAPSECDTSAAPSTGPALPQGSEPVEVDPANFVSTIDHPYRPLLPGARWVYRETDDQGGVQKVVITVTDKKKTILGVDVTVVHDVVSENGKPVEDTWDWYAQDTTGNLWYFGEDTKEYENGKVKTTKGSWEAGVDGAQPGIILPAVPQAGMTYREEYYKGSAEDGATILSTNEKAGGPTGLYECAILTKNYTPLEPEVWEYKLYAKGVGPVIELTVSPDSTTETLTKYRPGH
jgi:uncharacterized protein YndB with AHSA1/START domain